MAEFRILKVQKLVGGGGRVHFEKAKRASSRLLSSTSQPIIGRLAVTIASSEIALFQTPPLPTPPHSTSVPTLQTNPGIGFRALLLSLSPFLSLSSTFPRGMDYICTQPCTAVGLGQLVVRRARRRSQGRQAKPNPWKPLSLLCIHLALFPTSPGLF